MFGRYKRAANPPGPEKGLGEQLPSMKKMRSFEKLKQERIYRHRFCKEEVWSLDRVDAFPKV